MSSLDIYRSRAGKLAVNLLMGGCAALIWQIASLKIHNALICPSLEQIAFQMMLQIQKPDFWMILAATVSRALQALAISFAAGFTAAVIAFFCRPAAAFLNAASGFLQAIPNVCYIILLLFWTTRTNTVLLVAFFLLFPLFYRALSAQLAELKQQWNDVWKIYPQPKHILIFKICLPAMQSSVSSSLKNASSLSFKVCVMTEILAGLSIGIGRSLQTARLDINVAGVIGWSLWLILLVWVFEQLWNLLLRLFYHA